MLPQKEALESTPTALPTPPWEGLSKASVSSIRVNSGPWQPLNEGTDIVESVAAHFREVLLDLGVDTASGGMKGTADRYARFIVDFTSKVFPRIAIFDEPGSNEMVIQNRIPLFSLCEHHTLPFVGTASVAYIPNGKIIGLSKLARLVDYFAKGFNTQERITHAVGEYLMGQPELKASGVGVSIRASHMCMLIRGAKAHGAVTTTQYLGGVMKTSDSARAEFLKAVEHD